MLRKVAPPDPSKPLNEAHLQLACEQALLFLLTHHSFLPTQDFLSVVFMNALKWNLAKHPVSWSDEAVQLPASLLHDLQSCCCRDRWSWPNMQGSMQSWPSFVHQFMNNMVWQALIRLGCNTHVKNYMHTNIYVCTHTNHTYCGLHLSWRPSCSCLQPCADLVPGGRGMCLVWVWLAQLCWLVSLTSYSDTWISAVVSLVSDPKPW